MLNPSTVSICRQYINKELNELQTNIYELQMLKNRLSILGEIPPKKRKAYLEVDCRLKKVKARRLKLENTIRDLKACVWTGNLKELPQCESVSIKSSPDFSRAWPFLPLPK